MDHIIFVEGVQVDHKKTEVMVDWSLPNDVSALRGLFGLIGYYKRYVKGYGLIAKPLTSMLNKEGFEWTKEARGAFKDLKRAMTNTPMLALPDFSKPFEIHTDASSEAIGAGEETLSLYF